jgi:hypothetical protein
MMGFSQCPTREDLTLRAAKMSFDLDFITTGNGGL